MLLPTHHSIEYIIKEIIASIEFYENLKNEQMEIYKTDKAIKEYSKMLSRIVDRYADERRYSISIQTSPTNKEEPEMFTFPGYKEEIMLNLCGGESTTIIVSPLNSEIGDRLYYEHSESNLTIKHFRDRFYLETNMDHKPKERRDKNLIYLKLINEDIIKEVKEHTKIEKKSNREEPTSRMRSRDAGGWRIL